MALSGPWQEVRLSSGGLHCAPKTSHPSRLLPLAVLQPLQHLASRGKGVEFSTVVLTNGSGERMGFARGFTFLHAVAELLQGRAARSPPRLEMGVPLLRSCAEQGAVE